MRVIIAITSPTIFADFLYGRGNETALLRCVEDAAVNGLEAVAHIGQRAADDYAHRIIEVAGLHLLDDGDGNDIAVARRRRAVVVDRRLSGQEAVLIEWVRVGDCGTRRLPPT